MKILVVGLDEKTIQFVKDRCQKIEFEVVSAAAAFEEAFSSWADGQFLFIVCGAAVEGVGGAEIAQVVTAQCPSTPKYFIAVDRSQYQPKSLIKNGFNGVFLFPYDEKGMEALLHERMASLDPSERVFRQVKAIDLSPQDKLEFDTFVYLPLNRKHVRFSKKSEVLDPEKVEKLAKKQIVNISIDAKDMSEFQRYTASKLVQLGGMSTTEAKEKLGTAVRTIILDIFDQSIPGDFETGKRVIEDSQKMISNFITKGASADWYRSLMSSMETGEDVYNHAGNVSTFAALFAIALGHPHPEDLALAGLFHDLGLIENSPDLLDRPLQEMSDDEKKRYWLHPEQTLTALKNKKVIVSSAVEKAILQHHEEFSGSGFPKKIAGDRISEDAQILSCADQFDKLVRVEPGKPRLGPAEALDRIAQTGTISPRVIRLLRDFLDRKPA